MWQYASQLDTRVTVNGFDMNGVDSYGSAWSGSLMGLTGVFDSPATSLSTSSKAWTDGWYRNVPTREGKEITITGLIVSDCPETALRSWEAFKAYILVDDEFTVTTTTGEYVRWMRCIQSSAASTLTPEGWNTYSYEINITCLDGRLYSQTQLTGQTGLPSTEGGMWWPVVFNPYEGVEPEPEGDMASWMHFPEPTASGSLSFTNPGTVSSPVTLQIYGQCVNPRVEHSPSGRVMQFTYTVNDNHYIQCDGSTHEITLDGSSAFTGTVSYRQWSEAEPGQNIWRFTAESGSDSCRLMVSFYPAYI